MLQRIIEFIFGTGSSGDPEDDFIRLTQLMQTEESIRQQILLIASAPKAKRQQSLDKITENMRSQNAPAKHIELFQLLRDDDLCQRLQTFDWNLTA